MHLGVPLTQLFFSFQTNQDWYFLKLTLELRSVFSNFTCDGVTRYTRNKLHMLLTNATSVNETAWFGGVTCLREGSYAVTLQLQPGGSTQNAEITVDSVSLLKKDRQTIFKPDSIS
jgi:hypothetical protein